MPSTPIHQASANLWSGSSTDPVKLLSEVVSAPAGSIDAKSIVAAHFLLGVAASQSYWHDESTGGMHSSPGANVPYSVEIHDQVIQHFTSFLEHSEHDRCLVQDEDGIRLSWGDPDVLKARFVQFGGGLVLDRWNDTSARWAVFPDFGSQKAPYRDDISLALDRRALAFFLSGRPIDAAGDLQAALGRSSWGDRAIALEGVVSEYYPNQLSDTRVSHLQGWIGWLLFEGGRYSDAADYLAACHAAMRPDDERATDSEISQEEAKLRTWYDFMTGGQCSRRTHAMWEIGHLTEGLNRSCSLFWGSDGFLMRLSLSLSMSGRFTDAFQHIENCCVISPAWNVACALRDALMDSPDSALEVASGICETFQADRKAGRHGGRP